MSKNEDVSGSPEKWAHFRFSVIGRLLAAPPARGELKDELEYLAQKRWRHPITGQWTHFGCSTIERWYYRALGEPKNPVQALSRKTREDCGTYFSLSQELKNELWLQYRRHPSWSYQLHADNLNALAQQNPKLETPPSVPTIRRFMKAHGLVKRPRRGRGHTAGVRAAEQRFEDFEIRSYESEYANALWHLDFHGGSLKVVLPTGQWVKPQLMAMLDDHSRYGIHAQWYLAESAENVAHGLCQGFQKQELPRALMSDNGSAELAHEIVQALKRLSIVHETTLVYSPYQNGKQESFWGQVEGRLLAMLEDCKDLTLPQLNGATQAWLEMEYNRKRHSETGQTPLERLLASKDVGRPCPSSDSLRQAFTTLVSRTQRQSDGTISLQGIRFELPSRYRHFKRVNIRFASWDLSRAYLTDPRSGEVICRLYPQDKHKNAAGKRRRKEPLIHEASPLADTEAGMAPLMRKLIAEYAATGLPPAYLPKEEER